MKEYIFGANILENLTTGMYQDSKVIYREYIQNACDQIDKAEREGLLKPGEGIIKIWLDRDKRTILIEDNATGIQVSSFRQTLGNIATSDKKIGEDKGFRGIGRLCGLAYCKELVFRSSVKGEDIESVMVCDAFKMRNLIEENNRGKKYTANDVLNTINHFEHNKIKDIDSHYFRVELNDINMENTDLLDFQQVKNYLSFVAPVPYQNSFFYRSEVYNHAQRLGTKIDEYNITINGETVLKRYTTVLKAANTGSKYDDIFGVHFHDFHLNGKLLAWMWVGVSKFQKAIPKLNQMRGLRLRKENIQIGGEDALQKLFKEDRGNSYFIGEVFAVHKDLIPNSQRDYFNENPVRAELERELRRYFNEELHKIYYTGSAINSAYKKIDSYEKKQTEFNERNISGTFINTEHKNSELKALLESRKEAESALHKINKLKDKSDGLMEKVIVRIESERTNSDNLIGISTITQPITENYSQKPITTRRTDKLSRFSKSERKLISKIFSIIMLSTEKDTAEVIIKKIEEGLQ